MANPGATWTTPLQVHTAHSLPWFPRLPRLPTPAERELAILRTCAVTARMTSLKASDATMVTYTTVLNG